MDGIFLAEKIAGILMELHQKEGERMDIYRRNLEALGKTHPHLAQMIEDTRVNEGGLVVARSLSGELQVNYKRADGAEIVINDSSDLSNLPERAADLMEQEEGTRIILLLGFGLGGYPEAIHTRLKGDGILIVYEALPELFKTVLQKRDLSVLLGSERFRLILGEDTNDFGFVSRYHRNIVQGKFYILKQNGCVALNEPAYERFRTKVTEARG